MGTPDFAIPSLEILVENGYKVVAVITAPDRPRGRGQKLVPSPVKTYALKNDLPVLQPANLKSEGFVADLEKYKANLQVVVAFRMLPELIWSKPKYGTFNLHASMLPQYRGAAPINWVLINGEHETGLTTFFIKHEIDTGSIIYQNPVKILVDDDAGTLHDKLMEKGAELVLKTVKSIDSQDYQLKVQKENPGLQKAPKIFKEMCEIDWTKNGNQIYNFVRGLSPYPGAWTTINGKSYKIYKVKQVPGQKLSGKAGTFYTDSKHYLNFQTGDSLVQITELQPQGKRRMHVEEFLRGNKL
jgi:methionyl-tRNA formyltransferase